MNRNNKFDNRFSFLKEKEAPAPMELWQGVYERIQVKPKQKTRFLWFSLMGLMLLSVATLTGYAFLQDKSVSQVVSSKNQKNSNVTHSLIEPENNFSDLPIANKEAEDWKHQTIKQTSVVKNYNSSTKGLNNTNRMQVAMIRNHYKRSGNVESAIEWDMLTPKGIDISLAQKENKERLAQRPDKNLEIRNTSKTIEAAHVKTIEAAQTKSFEGKATSTAKLKEKPQKDNPDKECAGSRVIKLPTSFFVDAYLGPVIGNTYFTTRTNEDKSYARLRDSTELNGVGIVAGMRLGYIHSNGLNIRAGIAYQQVKTVFKYSIEDDEKMIITTIRDDQGAIIGRDTSFKFGRRDLSIVNAYRTVDVPISIGYLSMKNKVQVGFHAGAVLNLNFSQNGTYLDQNNGLTSIEEQKLYKKNIGVSFFGSVELQYLLGKQWGVFIEPQVRFYPESFTLDTHPVKQNITTFNILTGIKYIF